LALPAGSEDIILGALPDPASERAVRPASQVRFAISRRQAASVASWHLKTTKIQVSSLLGPAGEGRMTSNLFDLESVDAAPDMG
jgi:hypothetical protein